LTKLGSGTLTLTAANTFNAGTTVNNGTLLANNITGSATGPGAIDVNGTSILGGTGNIAGNVTLNSTSKLSPGTDTQVEDISIGGNLTFNNTSSLYAQVAGSAPGTGYDQVSVGGSVTIGATATLAGVTSVAQAGGTNLTLINKTSAGAITGNFANAVPPSPPATVNLGARSYEFNYAAGTGSNDFVLTSIVSTLTWDGGGADNNWTTAANWVGDVAPIPGDVLVFSDLGVTVRNSPSNNFAAASQFTINVTNTANSYTFGGNSVDLVGSGFTQSGGGSNTLNQSLLGAAGLSLSAGTLTVSTGTTVGGSNSVTITGGTLLANGTFSNSGLNTVGTALPGTGTLGGNNGTFSSMVTLNAGGTVSPGSPTNTVGTLSMFGIEFNGGTYAADLDGNTHDRINVANIVNIKTAGTAGVFVLTRTNTQTAGSVYPFISNSSASAISNPPFNGIPEGFGTTVSGGQSAAYSYIGGVGANDFVLVVAGTPAAFVGDVGDTTNDFIIREVAGNIQVERDGVIIDSRPAGLLAGATITINGLTDTDTLLVDYTAAPGLMNVNIMFNGGESTGDDDRLTINDAPGNAHTITHTVLATPNPDWSGTIAIDEDGNAVVDRTINYTGLEPVTDNLSAVNRIFTFTGLAETVTLSDGAGAGISQIVSTLGENVLFANPSASLTINLTSGNDILNIGGLDGAFNANLTTTQDGGDTVNITAATNIGAGNVSITADTIAFAAAITTTGSASLTAAAAGITNSTAATTDLTATSLTATAVTAIALDTSVDQITASTTNAAITIREASGLTDLNLAAGTGDVTLTLVAGNIVDTAADGNDIVGTNLLINMPTGGSIGIPANRVEIDGTQLRVTYVGAAATNDVYLEDTAGGLQLNDSSLSSSGSSTTFDLLVTNGSLTSVVGGNRDIGADILVLQVTGAASTIGVSAAARLETNSLTRIDATTAGGSIFLVDTDNGMPVGLINAGAGDVDLSTTDTVPGDSRSITESGADCAARIDSRSNGAASMPIGFATASVRRPAWTMVSPSTVQPRSRATPSRKSCA
jgi:autotransporter-associated beta strand protein